MPLTAWALTTGEAGMRTQARGLAQAVADVVVEKVIDRGLIWPWLGRLPASLAPPWPDLVISCGRRSASLSIAIRKASGGRCLTVHIQDPRVSSDRFDLVLAMAHDRIAPGGNVIKLETALHDLTPGALEAAGAVWAPRFAALGRPLIGVAVGGDLKGRAFSLADGRKLRDGLIRLKSVLGAGLAITPSRRTPIAVQTLLAEAFASDPRVFLWDMTGDNPYRGILALADRLVVTSDSVSMVSEALSTQAPVDILDLGFARHVSFVGGLVTAGLARRFTGDPDVSSRRTAVDATQTAAETVRGLLAARGMAQARTGRSG